MKTINLKLSWAEAKAQEDGSIVLEIGGNAPGGNSHKVRLRMGPSSIGYIADTLHEAVNSQQATLDLVKTKLKGSP